MKSFQQTEERFDPSTSFLPQEIGVASTTQEEVSLNVTGAKVQVIDAILEIARTLSREHGSTTVELVVINSKITDKKLLNIADEGFKIVDASSVTTEDFSHYNIATVLLEKSKHDKNQYIPIVLPHADSVIGKKLREVVNNRVKDEVGAMPLEAIGPSHYAIKSRHQAERRELVEQFGELAGTTFKWLAVASVIGTGAFWGGGKLIAAIEDMQEASYQQSVKNLPSWETKIKNIEGLPTDKAKLEEIRLLTVLSCGCSKMGDIEATLFRPNEAAQIKSIDLSGRIIKLEVMRPRSFFSGPSSSVMNLWNEINTLAITSPYKQVRYAAATQSVSIYQTARHYTVTDNQMESMRNVAVHTQDAEVQKMLSPVVGN